MSRTVNTSGKLVAFEYLRIVERDGGLVYIAQPGGKTATRAVFDNPRHDYPKRIVYELTAEGVLTAAVRVHRRSKVAQGTSLDAQGDALRGHANE